MAIRKHHRKPKITAYRANKAKMNTGNNIVITHTKKPLAQVGVTRCMTTDESETIGVALRDRLTELLEKWKIKTVPFESDIVAEVFYNCEKFPHFKAIISTESGLLIWEQRVISYVPCVIINDFSSWANKSFAFIEKEQMVGEAVSWP